MFGYGKEREPKQPMQLVIEVASSDKAKKRPAQPEVRARKFVLEDADCNVRAQLQSAGNGAVALTFHDQEGKMGVLLGLDPNQSPTLALVKEGKLKAGLEMDKTSGEPALTLSGPGKSKVVAGYDEKSHAHLDVVDIMGTVRVSITLDPSGKAEISVFDRKGFSKEKISG